TPAMSVGEVASLGFRIVIFPTLCLEAVVPRTLQALEYLKTVGRQEEGAMGPQKLFEICGLDEAMELDRRAGGKAFHDQ
ncbi:hypothetical protein LTR28_005599, partial [Elasticomyces elasticus]